MDNKQDLISQYHYSLGFSYRYAVGITLNVLADLKKEQNDKLLLDILGIFEDWKLEHGIYPPPRNTLLNFNPKYKGQAVPVKEYLKKQDMAAALSGEEPVHIDPWECDAIATTPLKLFSKLISEKYKPLVDYLLHHQFASFEHIYATVIIINFDNESEYKSTDCIEASLDLASKRLLRLNNEIVKLEPHAKETIKKRNNAKIAMQMKKERTERMVMDLHAQFQKDGLFPPLKEYAALLDLSAATISRYLRKNGCGRHK